MCHLYGKFASYLRPDLCKKRLIFPRINGPNILAKEQLKLIFLSNWTSSNWKRINFLSSHLNNTQKVPLSLLTFQINTDTPLASLHLFSSNTPSHSIQYLHYIKTFFSFFIGISYQVGKVNASETRQGWNCNSGCEAPQHCTLPRCTNVVFPQTFISGSGTVSKP